MSDPRRRDSERHSSPFWGMVLVFLVVMTGLIAYAYHGAHSISGSTTETTEGRASDQASQPKNQGGGENN